MSSQRQPTQARAGKVRGLAEWRPQIEEWLDAGEYDLVLNRFEEWDRQIAEWWTQFGPFLDRIPSDLIQRRPRILLRTVLPALWAGREADAYVALKSVEELAASGDDPGLAVSAKAIRASLYVVSKRLDDALELLTSLEREATEPKDRLQVLNALGLLQATHSFDLDVARQSFSEHARLALDAGVSIAHIVALINLAWHVEIIQGRFREAKVLGRKLMNLRSSPNDSPFGRMCASMILGAAAYELGEEEAVEYFTAAFEMGERFHYGDIAFASAEYLAMRYAETGEVALSQEWLARCRERQNDEKRPSPLFHRAMARLSALSEDSSGVQKHLAFASAESSAPDIRSETDLEWSRCLYFAGRWEEAAEKARSALAVAERYGLQFTATRARLLCCACEIGGIREPLAECLKASLAFDYDDLFLRREPEIGQKVLNQAMALGVETEYALSLLDRMGCPTVRVRLFGGLRLWVGVRSVPESAWLRPKARSVFAYLVLLHGRPVPADRICLEFWPDQDPEDARNSLRVALTYVRKALEPDRPKGRESRFVRFEEDMVVLDLGQSAWIDAAVFERLSKRVLAMDGSDIAKRYEACKQATEVVDGSFLPEYAGQEWVEGWDDRLSSALRDLLLRACGDALALGRPEAVLPAAEELLAVDRCDEAALNVQVEAMVRLGRDADAARAVRKFAKVWEDELGLELPASVRAHLDRLSR